MHNEFLNNSINNALSEQTSLLRYAIVIEYIGTKFFGSQLQPEGRTVQGEIESVLEVLLKSPTRAVFAGRTDAGVHAKGQVVHFNSERDIDCSKFLNSMNALLPPDISVSNITLIDGKFHAIKSARKKHYRYAINNASQRSVWKNQNTHCRYDLDIDAMQKALNYILGEHNFVSFRSSNTINPAEICTIDRADCTRDGDMIYIDFVGNRFLYNMIRIIVGTVLEVGRKEKSPEWLRNVIEAQDRTQAGPTAPSMGLTLMSVKYEDKYNNIINKEANDENLLSKAS